MMLLTRYKELGEDFDPKTIELKNCLRVNTLKISAEELVQRLVEKGVKLEKVPFLDNGYFLIPLSRFLLVKNIFWDTSIFKKRQANFPFNHSLAK